MYPFKDTVVMGQNRDAGCSGTCPHLVEKITIQELGVIDGEVQVSKEGPTPDGCNQRGDDVRYLHQRVLK